MKGSRPIPGGRMWNGVGVRTLQVAAISLVGLAAEEYAETQRVELQAIAIDTAWISGAAIVIFALLVILAPRDQAPR